MDNKLESLRHFIDYFSASSSNIFSTHSTSSTGPYVPWTIPEGDDSSDQLLGSLYSLSDKYNGWYSTKTPYTLGGQLEKEILGSNYIYDVGLGLVLGIQGYKQGLELMKLSESADKVRGLMISTEGLYSIYSSGNQLINNNKESNNGKTGK